jgi:hypothetical protein
MTLAETDIAKTRFAYRDDRGRRPHQVSQLLSERCTDRLDILADTDADFSWTDVVEECSILHENGCKVDVPQPFRQEVRRRGDCRKQIVSMSD